MLRNKERGQLVTLGKPEKKHGWQKKTVPAYGQLVSDKSLCEQTVPLGKNSCMGN